MLTSRSLTGLQPATIHSLSTAGMKVVTVRRMKKADIRDMSEERWNDNYTKLRLWQLAYERIIFLDSDMLVLQVRSLIALLVQKYKYGHLRSCVPAVGSPLLLALLVQKYKY